jgi:hypothetical protein
VSYVSASLIDQETGILAETSEFRANDLLIVECSPSAKFFQPSVPAVGNDWTYIRALIAMYASAQWQSRHS